MLERSELESERDVVILGLTLSGFLSITIDIERSGRCVGNNFIAHAQMT